MLHNFDSDSDSHIGRWISCVYRAAHVFLDRTMEKYGIGSGQIYFMRVLMFKEGMSQNELSEILNIDKATTARAIKKLSQKGYVKREIDPIDCRGYRLFLTAQGREIGEELKQIMKYLEELFTKGFSEQEKQMLSSLLKRVAENSRPIRHIE